MNITALIMAGGRGERFWPMSRAGRPKQFLDLTGDGKTMLQKTAERILPLVKQEDIYIAANEEYRDTVMAQLPGIPERNILCEPAGRNTAPCIGLGALRIREKYEDALMIVLPSDHLIKMTDRFVETLRKALALAEQGKNLVTMGITPTYPETGYGYIRCGEPAEGGTAFRVRQFTEKPPLAVAEEYLASGEYLWNSGMFVWKLSSILENMRVFLPEMTDTLLAISKASGTPEEEQVLKDLFPGIRAESIDYGILEKAEDIFTIPGDFGWDDVGSWLSVGRVREADGDRNVISGDCIAYDSQGNIIQGGRRLIAAVGVEDLVIVDTEDAVLVAKKERTGEIREILKKLRDNGRNELL